MFQIDNQSVRDPVYPVMMKVKQEFVKSDQGVPVPNQYDFMQLQVIQRRESENVMYIELVEFLMQHLELKLELSHLVKLSEFGTRVVKILETNINSQHKIYLSDRRCQLDRTTLFDEGCSGLPK